MNMNDFINYTGENSPKTVETAPIEIPTTPVEGLAQGPILHVFAETAPKYFAANLPVIPLDPMSKGTRMNGWQNFHDHMPSKELQEQWLKMYVDGNIGLVLGAASGICMIDIDTPDPKLVNAITNILPDSPWCKIGSKGVTLAFKFNGTQSFRIRGQVGGMLVEHLSSKTQTVLPPSIHPDTRRPYVSNCNLWEVLDQLKELPLDIEERLRTVLVENGHNLSTKGYTKLSDKISVGSRDVSITQRAGLYATLVMRGEKSLIEAAGELRANISMMVENVAGDPVDPEKHVRNMVMFLKRDVLERKKRLPKGWDAGLTAEDKTSMGLDFDAEQVEWSANEIIAYLKSEFETHTAESEGRTAAIDKILDQLKNTKSLKDIDQERVLSYIVQTSGMNIKLGTLRKNLRERKTGEMTGTTHSQLAEALLEDYKRTSDLKFYKGAFWRWGGSHWIKMERHEILSKIVKEYGEMPAAKRWSDHNGIYNTMSTLCAGELGDSNEFGVNFANGFLRRDMVMEEHRPGHGMMYTLPYRYMPEDSHRCPKWLEFLKNIWGEDADYLDKVECLRDVMCATMFGLGPSMQRAVLLYGIPHSGKSQVLDVMMGLMDPNTISTVSPKMWGDKFSPVQMVDKLLNVCGELGHDQRIDGSSFKMIVSGDAIEVQYKGQQNFTTKPTPTHWFSSNHIPKSNDDTGGFARRWIVLTFNRKIQTKDVIMRYAEVMLAEEREAICAWVMEAAHKFKTAVVPTFPKSHQLFIHEMFNLHNSVRMFLLDSGLVVGHDADQSIDEYQLHQRYWSYCVQGGMARPVSQKFFRPKAREFEMDLGFKIVVGTNPKTGGEEAHYVGLQLFSKR